MDVIALIQRLGLVAPTILGHSMGGMTAAVVASRMAGSISRLILADPTFISPQWQREIRDSSVAEKHRRVLELGKADILADLSTRHPDRSSQILELIAEARLQTRMSAFDVLTPPIPEYQQLVRDIHVPIMLIIADAGVMSLGAARELQSLNPRIQIEQIQCSGHAIPFDRPKRFEAVVRSFLRIAETIPGTNRSSMPHTGNSSLYRSGGTSLR